MKTEKQKMLAGELYNALDKEISDERMTTRRLNERVNDSAENQQELRAKILKELLPDAHESLWIQ